MHLKKTTARIILCLFVTIQVTLADENPSCAFSEDALPNISAREIAPYILVENDRLKGTRAYRHTVPITGDWSRPHKGIRKAYLYRDVHSVARPGEWTVLVIDKLSGSLEPEGGFWFRKHDELVGSYLRQLKSSLQNSGIRLTFLRINKLANRDMMLGDSAFGTTCMARSFPESTSKNQTLDLCFDRFLYLDHGSDIAYSKYDRIRQWLSRISDSVCYHYRPDKELPLVLLIVPNGNFYNLPTGSTAATVAGISEYMSPHRDVELVSSPNPVSLSRQYRSRFTRNRLDENVAEFINVRNQMFAHIAENLPRSIKVVESLLSGGDDVAVENIDQYASSHEFRRSPQ